MNTITKGAAVLTAALLATAGLATTAQADTGTTTTIRQSDLISALSDTRSAGHVAFLTDGLHVWTDDATSQAKAAEYFALSGGLPDTASMTWFGTQPQPGVQIVFDLNSDRTDPGTWNVLVGEANYYGTDYWLSSGSSAAAKLAAPSCDGDPAVATASSDQLIADGHCTGGSGTAWHGTLADWQAGLPGAQTYAGGFSLGSGVKGDGVIDSITYDDATYRFTNEPATPEPVVTDVTGYATKKIGTHGFRLRLYSVAQPDNTVMGQKLTWKVKVDGKTVFVTKQGFGAYDMLHIQFPRHSGKHVVDVYKNGAHARHFFVRTG